MNIRLPFLRTAGLLASLVIFAGCAELHTDTPFGTALRLKVDDKKTLEGRWETPAPPPEMRVSYTLTFNEGDSATLVARSASGKTWTYEALFRQIKGAHDSGGPAVFFKRKDDSETDWRFAWIGQALGSDVDKVAKTPVRCLVLVFPDENAAKKFGLPTREGSYAQLGSGVPGSIGVVSDKPAGMKDKDWTEAKNARTSTQTLTGTPESLMAELAKHDLRTMMLPLNPMVLIRADSGAAGTSR